MIRWTPLVIHISVDAWFYNSNLVYANDCWWSKIEGNGFLCLQWISCVWKYHKWTDSIFLIKSEFWDSLKWKHIKNNRVILYQWTIAANIPTHMFVTKLRIIAALITHCNDNDCRMEICTKQAPFCSGKYSHVTD